MKRLLITLMTIGPIVTFAQKDDLYKWELGVAGGLSSNSVHAKWQNHSYMHTANFTSQFSLAKNLSKHFQAGVEVCPTTISYNETISGVMFQYIYGQPGAVPLTLTHKVVIGNPALPICLFSNYRTHIRGMELYAGIAAGYVATTINNMEQHVAYDRTKYGFTFGGQIGAQHHISKRFSIYVEADFRNLSLHETAVYYSYLPSPLYYYNVLVGMHYGF